MFAKAPPLPQDELDELLLPVAGHPHPLLMEEEVPEPAELRRRDLAALVSNFKVFQQSVEVLMNYHRIHQRKSLAKNVEAVYAILRRECRKMESSLNMELAEVMGAPMSAQDRPQVKVEAGKELRETAEDAAVCKREDS